MQRKSFTLDEITVDIIPIIYTNITKMTGKNSKCLVYFIISCKGYISYI